MFKESSGSCSSCSSVSEDRKDNTLLVEVSLSCNLLDCEANAIDFEPCFLARISNS
jgi:hypothetical protein